MPEKGLGLRQEPRGIEGGNPQGHAPGLDLGHVEDVVDEGQEVIAAALDDGQALALGGRQLGVPDQYLGEANDGVHGGTDFVAHVGQEGALGLVGGLQFRRALGNLDLQCLVEVQQVLPRLLQVVFFFTQAGLGSHQISRDALPDRDFPGQPAVPQEENDKNQRSAGQDLPYQPVVALGPNLHRAPFLVDGIDLGVGHGRQPLVDQ